MPTKTSSSKIQQDVVARTASQSSLSSATAIASESLQEMVDEMESQLNHVMSSPVFQPEEVHASHTEEEEKADAFRDAEPPTFDDKDIVKTLDVPRWLGDENVVGKLFDLVCIPIFHLTFTQLFNLEKTTSTVLSKKGV